MAAGKITGFVQKPSGNTLITGLGVLFLILGLIGIVVSTYTTWLRTEFGSTTEDYRYGDFGEDFEEEIGGDVRDNYYGASARMALIGFIIVLLFGILFIIEGLKGFISRRFISRLFRFSPGPNESAIRSTFVVCFLILLIIPLTFAILGGARFIGLATSWQAAADSREYIEGTPTEYNFSTTAGYAVVGLGFFIFIVCLIIIIKEFPNIKLASDVNQSKYTHSQKLQKFLYLILLVSVIVIISIPLLPFMVIERKYESIEYDWDDEGNRIEFKVGFYSASYDNDGDIYIMGETGGGDNIDDIYEELSFDIGLIAWTFTLIFLFTIGSLFGAIFYRLNRFPRGSHWLMFLGCVIIILVIIPFIGFGLAASDVGKMDEELNKEIQRSYTQYGDYGYVPDWKEEVQTKLGSNFIPLVGVILIFIFGFLFTKAFWPVSMTPVLGERRAIKARNYFSKPNAKKGISGVFFIIPVIIIGSGGYFYYAGADDVDLAKKELVPLISYEDLEILSYSESMNGYSDEWMDQDLDYTINASSFVERMTLTLQWTDEPDETFRHENDPDEFWLMLETPENDFFESQMVANDASTKQGSVTLETTVFDPPVGWQFRDSSSYENTWTIWVCCGECGDHRATGPAMFIFNDFGNDWDLTIEVSYYYLEEEQ